MNNKRNPHYRRNLLLFTLVCIFIGWAFLQFVGYPYYLSYGHSHPKPQPVCTEWYYRPIDFFYYRFLTHHTGVTRPVSLKQALSEMTPRPILLISSRMPTEQHRVEYLFAAAQEPKSLWVIPDAEHIGGFRLYPQEYEDKIIRFFDEALLDQTIGPEVHD